MNQKYKRVKAIRFTPKGRSADRAAASDVRATIPDILPQRDLLLEYLHRLQDRYHCLRADHIVALADAMKLAPADVFEVATFYHHFDMIKEKDAAPPPLSVRVCDSLSCQLAGASTLQEALSEVFDRSAVRVQSVSCVGRCAHAPVAVVQKNPIDEADVDRVRTAVESGEVEPRLPAYVELEEYRRRGGYALLSACHSGTRCAEDILQAIEASGLRGLGGAGFPAARKWRIVSGEPAPRLLAINIDEGEPGTFKDRHYLERDPHRLLERALIAAWVVGIDEIYLYLRDEYAACHALLAAELAALRQNPPVALPPIHLRRGAGAYICGEESAMIESIEGKRGLPRLRPPYIAQRGLFGRPTLEHNLETLYWVRDIVAKGPDCLRSHGRHGSHGLRSFSVSGRVRNPGMHLAPAGITVRELIDEYCGGMASDYAVYSSKKNQSPLRV